MSQDLIVRFAGQKDCPASLGESILEVALRNEIDIDHACGGVCACSTCHIKVESSAECLNESTEDEEDQLDTARGVALNSRLGCQARIEKIPESGVIEVRIPEWNVNLVKEHH